MANSAQAKKRDRQAKARREDNVSKRTEMRTYIKQVVKAIEAGSKAPAETIYKKATSTLDSLVGKGIIHKNKAARHKSRLNARIKALATA